MKWECGTLNMKSQAQGTIEIGDPDGTNVGCAYYDARDQTRTEAKRNARIMAAAPEMLELLKQTLEEVCHAQANAARSGHAIQRLLEDIQEW